MVADFVEIGRALLEFLPKPNRYVISSPREYHLNLGEAQAGSFRTFSSAKSDQTSDLGEVATREYKEPQVPYRFQNRIVPKTRFVAG